MKSALIRWFFHKNRKDLISFSLILFLTTILFSGALVLGMNIFSDYDARSEELRAADCFFTIPDIFYSNDLEKKIADLSSVSKAECRTGLSVSAKVDMDGSAQEQNQILYSAGDTPEISQARFAEDSTDETDGIYLNQYTRAHWTKDLQEGYALDIDEDSCHWPIKGGVEEMMYGNYSSSVIGQYLDEDLFDQLWNDHPQNRARTLSVLSDDESAAYDQVSRLLAKEQVPVLFQNTKSQSKNQRLAVVTLIIVILMVFAASMLVISLLVIRFKIVLTIEQERRSMGVLESEGYRPKDLIACCIAPWLTLGAHSTLLGIAASYLILPLLGQVVFLQSGFAWNASFDPLCALIVLASNMLLILLFTYRAASAIKKLNPVQAIRQIPSGKKVMIHYPLETTGGSLRSILIRKQSAAGRRQNVLLGAVLFFFIIVCSFVAILFYNISISPENFVNTLVEEHPSVVFQTSTDINDELARMEGVRSVQFYNENLQTEYEGRSYKTIAAQSYDDLANNFCYRGTNPGSANEAAIGSSIASDYGLSIGDHLVLEKDGRSATFVISGLLQSVNYSGNLIELSEDGYKKLDPDYQPSITYVYLDPEEDSASFIDQAEEKFKDEIVSSMDYAGSMRSATTMYVSLVQVVSIVLLVLTMLLIFLVLCGDLLNPDQKPPAVWHLQGARLSDRSDPPAADILPASRCGYLQPACLACLLLHFAATLPVHLLIDWRLSDSLRLSNMADGTDRDRSWSCEPCDRMVSFFQSEENFCAGAYPRISLKVNLSPRSTGKCPA